MAGAIETNKDNRQSKCMHDVDSALAQVVSWCEGVGSWANAVQVRGTSALGAKNKREAMGTEESKFS